MHISVRDSEVFFITYDEPQKDEFWHNFKATIPWAKRIDGICGFDAAHKECARLSQSERFFTIDGDNIIDDKFCNFAFEEEVNCCDAVFSWSSCNTVNGLAYGNGGIKNWPKDIVKNMRTHELNSEVTAAVDFCFTLNYFQMSEILSRTVINLTAYQAFRAGFREGVKLSLNRGQRVMAGSKSESLGANICKANLDRLRIWCGIGLDMANGDWAIYGARLGCERCCLYPSWDIAVIRDYEWFENFWQKEIAELFNIRDVNLFSNNIAYDRIKLLSEIHRLGNILNDRLFLDIILYQPNESRFFKSVYNNPLRYGWMFKG